MKGDFQTTDYDLAKTFKNLVAEQIFHEAASRTDFRSHTNIGDIHTTNYVSSGRPFLVTIVNPSEGLVQCLDGFDDMSDGRTKYNKETNFVEVKLGKAATQVVGNYKSGENAVYKEFIFYDDIKTIEKFNKVHGFFGALINEISDKIEAAPK